MGLHFRSNLHFSRQRRDPTYSKSGWFNRTFERIHSPSVPIARTDALCPRSNLSSSAPITIPPDSSAVRKFSIKIRAFVNRQKNWIKLNISYLAGTLVGSVMAFGSAYAARRFGIDKTAAATVVASTFQYMFAMTAVCISWLFLQKDHYAHQSGKWALDSVKMFGNTALAQGITWAITWPMTALFISLGASGALAVTLQTQVLDRLIFIPLFNFFNRRRVKEMETYERMENSASHSSSQIRN